MEVKKRQNDSCLHNERLIPHTSAEDNQGTHRTLTFHSAVRLEYGLITNGKRD